MKPTVAFFDTKAYDRDSFLATDRADEIEWSFHSFRLESATVPTVAGAQAACIFVNDQANAEALKGLAETGVRHLALRSAGHNNVDLEAARSAGLRVTRVPAYSPYAVAEHTLALLLALNRRIYRAYNRVRELNFP